MTTLFVGLVDLAEKDSKNVEIIIPAEDDFEISFIKLINSLVGSFISELDAIHVKQVATLHLIQKEEKSYKKAGKKSTISNKDNSEATFSTTKVKLLKTNNKKVKNKKKCPLDNCSIDCGDLKKQTLKHQPQLYCSNCSKCFNNVTNRESHECGHVCTVCSRVFKSSSDLGVHLTIHTGGKLFVCDICGNSFGQRSTLDRHKQTHSKENRFQCSDCGKYFRHKHYLSKHRLIHQGIRPHVCHLCDKTFAQRSNLSKHQKQNHSINKEFMCPLCSKEFVALYYLNRHLLTHKEQRAVVELGLPSSLLDQHQTCYGIRTIRCGLCSVTVKTEENLRKHLEDFHTSTSPYSTVVQ